MLRQLIMLSAFLCTFAFTTPNAMAQGQVQPLDPGSNCYNQWVTALTKYQSFQSAADTACGLDGGLGVTNGQANGKNTTLCNIPPDGAQELSSTSERCKLIRCKAAANTCSIPVVEPSAKEEAITTQQKFCDERQTQNSAEDYQDCMTELQSMQKSLAAEPKCKNYEAAWKDTHKDLNEKGVPVDCNGKAAQEQLTILSKNLADSTKDLHRANSEFFQAESEAGKEATTTQSQIQQLQNKLQTLQAQKPILETDGSDQLSANLTKEQDDVNQQTIRIKQMAQIASSKLTVALQAASNNYNNAIRAAFAACQTFLFSKGNAPLTQVSSLDQAGQVAASASSGGSSSTSSGILNYRCQRNLAFQNTTSQAYQDEQTAIQTAQLEFRQANLQITTEQQKLKTMRFNNINANNKLAHDMAAKLTALQIETNGVSAQLALLQQSNLTQMATQKKTNEAYQESQDAQKLNDANSCWVKVIEGSTHQLPKADDLTKDRGDALSDINNALASDPCKPYPGMDFDQCRTKVINACRAASGLPPIPPTPSPTPPSTPKGGHR